MFWPNFLRRTQIFEKTGKKAVFGQFSENDDKKIVFFGARSPAKLVYIGAKGAFRKILGSINQKWKSQNSTKAGGHISERVKVRPPPSPLNPPQSQRAEELGVKWAIQCRIFCYVKTIFFFIFTLFLFLIALFSKLCGLKT